MRVRLGMLALVVPVAAILLMIALAMLSACFSPNLSRCSVRCKPGDSCPGGMTCSADNYCHAEGDADACEPQTFDLTVTRSGQGHGRIIGRDNLDCASMQLTDCRTTAAEGVYEITAIADPDSRVLGWEIDGEPRDDCAQRDRCAFDLGKATTVDVKFGAGRTLTVNVAGRGTNVQVSSQDARIKCSLADGMCTQGYDIGTQVVLQPSPAPPFFLGWTGCISSTNGTCVITLDDNKTVTATFDVMQVQLIGVPTSGGTLTLNGQTCSNQNCIVDLPPGMQTLTLNAAPGFFFDLDRWVNTPCENQQPVPNPCVYTSTTDQIAIAIFEELPFVRIIPPPFGFGSISMTGTFKGAVVNRTCIDNGTGGNLVCIEHFDPTSTVTLKANPAAGHMFRKWNFCPDSSEEMAAQCDFPIPRSLHVTITPQIQ